MEIVNSCEANNGGCSHGCSHTSAGPLCTCPHGYELDEDQKTCIGAQWFPARCPPPPVSTRRFPARCGPPPPPPVHLLDALNRQLPPVLPILLALLWAGGWAERGSC